MRARDGGKECACLSRFTGISILPLYIICHALDLLKCIIGAYMLKQGKWIQNLTQ